jgi:hypothetical protein
MPIKPALPRRMAAMAERSRNMNGDSSAATMPQRISASVNGAMSPMTARPNRRLVEKNKGVAIMTSTARPVRFWVCSVMRD